MLPSQRQSAGRPPRGGRRVRPRPVPPRPFQRPERDPSGHAAGGDRPTWPPVPLCFPQEIPPMTECILDQPISSAWPVASDWLETFLHDGGNRWDHRIASVMTADAVTAALAHSTRPVRLVGVTTGATAQISLQAHSTGQPQEWTALSPDRRGCAAAAAPTHPTLRRRSPPQHGRRRNLALVPPAAAAHPRRSGIGPSTPG